MASHVKMTFQPPPHLPYVQGWPGILGSEPDRKPPAVHGTLELRVGNHQVKAKMLYIELVRLEVLPGSGASIGQTVITPVGPPITVWKAGEGKEYDVIESADYRFHIPLPLNIPPSVELPKNGGIKYEIQANFHYKAKGGLLRKDTKPVITVSQPIFIMKHELHSAWPVYNVPETRNTIQEEMELIVHRAGTAFGHTDRVELNVTLKSSRPKPLKLRAFEVGLQEITTLRPPPAKGARQSALNRQKSVHDCKMPIGTMIGRGQEITRTMSFVVPHNGMLITVKGGKAIDVAYEMNVTAIMEGTGDLKVEHLQCTVGIYPRIRAMDLVNQIGFVPALCPLSPRPSSVRSMSTSAPSSVGPGRTPLMAMTPWPEAQPSGGFPQQNGTGRPTSLAPDAFRGYGQPPPPNHLRPDGAIRPFVPRPLSADSSSLYSQSQYQDSSPMTANRSDMVHNPNETATSPNRRPFSIGSANSLQGQQANNLASDMRRMSFTPIPASGTQPAEVTSVSRTDSQASHPGDVRRVSQGYLTEKRATLDDPGLRAPSMRSRRSPRLSVVNVEPELAGPFSSQVPPPQQAQAGSSSRRLSVDESRRERWSSAEDEKKRLFEEARRKAAATQMSSGANLASMGLEPPPAYSAPEVSSVAQEAYQAAQEAKERDVPLLEAEKMRSEIRKTEDDRYTPVPSPSPGVNRLRPISLDAASSQGHLSVETAQETRSGATSTRGSQELRGPEQPDYSQSGVGSGTGKSPVRPPVTALTEKEQMRRFYEAQARVAVTQGIGVVGGSSGGRQYTSAAPLESPLTEWSREGSATSSTYQKPYQEERDVMRKRYEEATQAAAVAQTAPPSTPPPSGRRPRSLERGDYDQEPQAGEAGGSATSATLLKQYPTAEEEKEMMRQRYEQATRAAAVTQGALAQASGSSSSPYRSPSPEVSVRQGKGKQVASSPEKSADKAPPLPPRPPAEYQQLLSPVSEAPPQLPLPGPLQAPQLQPLSPLSPMQPQMIYPGYFMYGMMPQGGPARYGY